MPLLVYRSDTPDKAPESMSRKLIRIYHGLIGTYGRHRARQKVHGSVLAERNREWTNEHGKKGRRR